MPDDTLISSNRTESPTDDTQHLNPANSNTGSQVDKAILEISKNLVEAMTKQTFQIEMTRNTLSAFLRRLGGRHSERRF